MLVSDLKPSVEGLNERSREVTFADMSVDNEAHALTIRGNVHQGGAEFPFDEQLERGLSKYLGVSKSYLAKCPPDLKAHNINYWLQAKPNLAAVIESLDDKFVSIHKPGLVVLPLRRVADIITEAMEPTDEVVQLLRSETRFHVDMITPHSVQVPTNDAIADRVQGERAIGDITHGGVRVLSNPTEAKAPSVTTYLHRLWCTNGCTSPEAEGEIKLKGNTVDEVLAEMNIAMQRVRGDLDNKLTEYAAMAQRTVPGSPTRFARQIGNEYGIPARVLNRVLDRIEILPEDQVSIYDIQQIFTQIANGTVRYNTMMRLQTLAGELAMHTDHAVHRCATCERLLPGDE